jgi:hypothetical protein
VTIPLTIAVVLFAFAALGFAKTYWSNRQAGVLIGAIACGVASLVSANLEAWWPLAVGFAVATIAGWFGFDPDQ